MNFYKSFFWGLFFQVTNLSCNCENTKIVHLDFCDFLNDVTSESDKTHTSKIYLEKSLNYVVEALYLRCWSDSTLENFIRKDELIQREIHNGYYRLKITFYKKTKQTEELIKLKSSRYLDYCENDITEEFEWVEGKFQGKYFYGNGSIKGTEDIKLDSLH